jgi:hypothetical protein
VEHPSCTLSEFVQNDSFISQDFLGCFLLNENLFDTNKKEKRKTG